MTKKKKQRVFIVGPTGSNALFDIVHYVCTTTERGLIGDIYDRDAYVVRDQFLSLNAAKAFAKRKFKSIRPKVI